MTKRIAMVALALALGACGGSSSSDGSGGGGGSDAGTGGGAGTAGSAGADAGACPADLSAAVGKPCAVEGQSCGGESCTDPCQFCNVLMCTGGKWQQLEAFPDPNCNDTGTGVCGGLVGATCADDEWCDMPDGCGFPDAQGICKKKPQGCTADCPGVCGCDGKFYCNTCSANAVGMDTGTSAACMVDGGGVGQSCTLDTECNAGLKCCYPCGMPDCSNQCMAPMPNGQCPVFP